jgi:hypothetical protein
MLLRALLQPVPVAKHAFFLFSVRGVQTNWTDANVNEKFNQPCPASCISSTRVSFRSCEMRPGL